MCGFYAVFFIIWEELKFYSGYITSQMVENYLLQTLSSAFTSTYRYTENRIARMDFKRAVENFQSAHVIAYSHDVDAQEFYSRVH